MNSNQKRPEPEAVGIRVIAAALCGIAALGMTAVSIAQSASSAAPNVEDWSTTNHESKLRGRLPDQIDRAGPGESIPITVVMRDQWSQDAREAASRSGSKSECRKKVISSLRQIAAESQADLLAMLRQLEAEHSVSNIRPLWIHNVIGLNASSDVIRRIAEREDVAYINWNEPIPVEEIFPVEPPDGGPGVESVECGVDLMDADRVWSELGITGAGVVVAQIDSGVCKTHPDIVNQIWDNTDEIPGNGIDDDGNGYIDDTWGWNFDLKNNNPDDFYGHGSHTAGTVAGDGTQGTQSGMAPDSEVMVLRISGDFSAEQQVWDATQYAVDNDADAITASLGWPHYTAPDRATWRAVCENAMAAGVVTIYAAGNEGCGTTYDNVRTPGDVPDMITVGATDCSDVKASFSSCGPVEWENVPPYNDWPYPPGKLKPTIAAPGVNTTSHSFCSGYTQLSGTSMATPHVAGAVALMLEANPDLDHFQVKQILKDTSIDLGQSGPDNQFGAGRVDAYEAVNEAIALRSCLGLRVLNVVAGQVATFTVSHNVSPGDEVAILWGTGGNGSSFQNELGYCASFDFDVPADKYGSRVIAQGTVDANGEFVAQVRIPFNLAGMDIMFQAAKRGTCPDECMSYLVERTIEAPAGCMNMTVDNLVAGEQATFTVTKNIVRGDYVAILWGLGGSPTKIRNKAGYCATFGFTIPAKLAASRIVAQGFANKDSEFVADVSVPANLAGTAIKFQAMKRDTCPDECTSNVVEEVVQ